MKKTENLEKIVAEIDLIVNSQLEVEQKYNLVFPSLELKLIDELKVCGFEFSFHYSEDDKRTILMAFLMHAKGYLNNIKVKS